MILEMEKQSLPHNAADMEVNLVRLASQGNAGAFVELSGVYMPVLQKCAGRYANIAGVDVEDFVQEGLFALYRAVKGYDEKAGVQFRTYATACINNSMVSAIRAHMKDSRNVMSINIDAMDEQKLHKQSTMQAMHTPLEDAFIDMEDWGLRAKQINALLSQFERQVLKLYLGGLPYQQIAVDLSATTKAVDNALQRVRRKLRPEP